MSMMGMGGWLVPGGLRVRVEMNMPVTVVIVFMRMDAQRLAQRPEANADQHHSDETLAPNGKPLKRQQIAEPE